MGDRSMTISSSPSSSNSLIAWSSASDARFSPSGDSAFDNRLLNVLEYSDCSPRIDRELRSFDTVLAFSGLDGADPNVYVLSSGVVGRRLWLSEYIDVLCSPLALSTVLMLAFDSDCAIEPVPRPPRRGFAVRRK